ncbi:MAG: 3-hydroxyisobutyryl-CoA hydrolase [Xanthobacteraceae bacterium]
MSERILQDGEVIARALGTLRRITLNRPRALNALTLGMAGAITGWLRAWANDETVGAVLIDGAGDRGFCAGGDIRALYDAARFGGPLPREFWATEYRLDVLIARYSKPVVVVMDGMVMGGGVGLSAHAAHRVVTERSAIGMPEVGIGYFPDVGAAYLLARAPGEVGTHLALTGEPIGAADAIFCGLADVHVPAENLAALPALLAACRTAQEVRVCLQQVSRPPAPGKLPIARQWIDVAYVGADVEPIIARLRAHDSDPARSASIVLESASPTSLKITLRNIRSALSFSRIEQSFQQDYRISLSCIAAHDFIEGIRAAVVDKDRKPVWRPDRLDDVVPEVIDQYFSPLGALELKFDP